MTELIPSDLAKPGNGAASCEAATRPNAAFKPLGMAAIVLSLSFLAFLLVIMLKNGLGGLDWDSCQGSDSTDPATAGIWGALQGIAADHGSHAGAVVPDGRAGGGLS
jgi:hypothetical protein